MAASFLGMADASLVLYGLIQGISEALPISSSLHTQLVSFWLDSWPESKATAALWHAGSIAGIALFYIKDLEALWRSVWRWRDPLYGPWRRLLGQLVAGNVGLGVAIGLVYIMCPWLLRSSPSLDTLAEISLMSAILLLAAHQWQRLGDTSTISSTATMQPCMQPCSLSSWLHAFLMGASQCVAMLWSGVSRLGATLTIACVLGYALPQSTRFSFLLGLPVMGASVLYGWWSGGAMIPKSYSCCVFPSRGPFMGLAMSLVVCVSTWGTLALMNHLAQRHCLWPIMVYRILLAIVVLHWV